LISLKKSSERWVEPSQIRVEADELTYHAHIYIRYQIEKSLTEGSIEVKDVPKVWNDFYEEILGIRPSSDADGCLQDVHWSFGGFGYFPTYSLGSFYAAQLKAALSRAIPDLDQQIENGNFEPALKCFVKPSMSMDANTIPKKS